MSLIYSSNCFCGNSICNHRRPFVNFHQHSSHSSDGVATEKNIVKRIKEVGNPAGVITDHGSPSGIFGFYKECLANGIKPILGLEFYAAIDIEQRIPNKKREVAFKDKHQLVLIQNQQGYLNYNELTYEAFTDGYYFKPRITYDSLFEKNEGLIVTTTCAASIFNQLSNIENYKEAEEWFKKFVNVFGDRFYGEIQFNELNDRDQFGMNQFAMNAFIIKMCNKYDVPFIITGDSHYAYPEDVKLQDIILSGQRRKDGPAEEEAAESFIHAKHLYYQTSEDYFKLNKEFGFNYEEKLITEALDNTLKLAERVDFKFELNKVNFPKYTPSIKTEVSNFEILKKLAFDGLYEKLSLREEKGEAFNKKLIQVYQERLEFELKILNEKDVVDYFLIVYDLLRWCREEGIAVGISRGSVGGSLTAYCISTISIDPVKHGLLFERFINPQRLCLTKENEILLKTGEYINIQELKVGDPVQTETGKGNLVQIIEREVEEEVFYIETEGNGIIELTGNHIIPVMRENKRIEIRVDELLETDLMFSF